MIKIYSKPTGTRLINFNVFTAGGIYSNGPGSQIVSCITQIWVCEPDSFELYPAKTEVGYINTIPTALLDNENNCRHFTVDGSLNQFKIKELANAKRLAAPQDGYLWSHDLVTVQGQELVSDGIVMWGSTGFQQFDYPAGCYIGNVGYLTGYKYLYWTGARDYMYVAEGDCTFVKRKFSSVRITKLTLDSTRTRFRCQSVSLDVTDGSLDNNKIAQIIADYQSGERELPVGYYASLNNFLVTKENLTVEDVDVSIDTIRSQLQRTTPESIFPGFQLDMSPFDSKVDWGELATQCACQLNTLSINGMAYSKDILELKKQVTALLKLLVDFDNPKKWASLYLSLHYGLRLTISDTKAISERIMATNEHLGPVKLQSSVNLRDEDLGISGVCHLAIYYTRCSGNFANLYYKLLEYDSQPWDLENLWDLIPFSFVIDWLVDVGGLLDQLDASNHSASVDIVAACYSIKLDRNMKGADFGMPALNSPLHARWYNRCFIPEAPPMSYSLDVPITNGFNHWIESGALILQKFFK